MNETKLQLEAGKYYRTRDGRKAFVHGLEHPFVKVMPEYPAYGFIQQLETDKVVWWDVQGNHSAGCMPYDLVAEWVEPKRIKGWLNIYSKHHIGSVHPTREIADANAKLCSLPFACIEIDVLEGQGLEGEAGR